MNKITLYMMMKPLNIASYILAVIFIILLTRAVIKAIRNNRQMAKHKKLHKTYEKNEKQLKQQGLKKFTFNGGKTIVWANDFKAANAQYQTSRKNGK